MIRPSKALAFLTTAGCLALAGGLALAQPTGTPPREGDAARPQARRPASRDIETPEVANPRPAGGQDAETKSDETTKTRRKGPPPPPPTGTTDSKKTKVVKRALVTETAPRKAFETGFGFGSYGRVGIASDVRGGPGRQLNFVTHGPRIGEGPYLELDLYYRMRPYKDVKVKTVVTLAFTEELFHFDGDWSSALALRNFYAEASDIFLDGLSVWIGSRMYRGDDIYLLDFWPLDNLNTIGGGVRLALKSRTSIAWHVGVNRLKDLYQYQEVAVPGLNNTSEDVVLMNRQRLITSLKAVQELGGRGGALGAKLKVYGELHHLPSGTLDANLPVQEQEHLEADSGWLLGLQAGLWNFGPRSHLNLFLRYASGLAAYGEFAIPFGLSTDKRAKRAKEFVLALSGNYELKKWFGVQVGGYARYFADADTNEYDWDDGWEYVAVVRPHLFLHRLFLIAAEVSYQARNPAGLNPWSHEKMLPGVTKLAIMPALTFGRGTYGRPQLRLIYMMTHQNKAARFNYNPEDPRRTIQIGHYFGIQAEWWFNSTYR